MVCGEEKMKLTWKIWMLLIILLISIIVIFNFQNLFQEGVLVKEVAKNTSEFDAGLKQGEIITTVNGNKISNLDDYSKTIISIFKDNKEEQKIVIVTKNSQYIFFSNKTPQISVVD